MKLSPRELESLLTHQVGSLAQKRLARGLKLNYTEATALIASQVSARDACVLCVLNSLCMNCLLDLRLSEDSSLLFNICEV